MHHKKYASFLYEIVESNFLVNSKIGKKSKDGIPNREFFLCMLLIAAYMKNKKLCWVYRDRYFKEGKIMFC